jgi:hypothetical protein
VRIEAVRLHDLEREVFRFRQQPNQEGGEHGLMTRLARICSISDSAVANGGDADGLLAIG